MNEPNIQLFSLNLVKICQKMKKLQFSCILHAYFSVPVHDLCILCVENAYTTSI